MDLLPQIFRGLLFLAASTLPVASAPEFKEQTFAAEIIRVQILSQFQGTAKLAAIDPRFVAVVRLKVDVEGLGKEGEKVAFAIHSPTRDLLISDYSSAAGMNVTLRLSRKKGAKRFYFWRVRPTKEPPSSGQELSVPESKGGTESPLKLQTDGTPK